MIRNFNSGASFFLLHRDTLTVPYAARYKLPNAETAISPRQCMWRSLWSPSFLIFFHRSTGLMTVFPGEGEGRGGRTVFSLESPFTPKKSNCFFMCLFQLVILNKPKSRSTPWILEFYYQKYLQKILSIMEYSSSLLFTKFIIKWKKRNRKLL